MNQNLPLVSEVRRLLRFGELAASPICFSELARVGLLHLDASSGRAVLTKRITRIFNSLPSDGEAITAVFACYPSLRTAWLRIACGWLREAGHRRDVSQLCFAISTLAEASTQIMRLWSEASLAPTRFGTLEIELLGDEAFQASVSPKLLRALGATAWLIEGSGISRNPISTIEAVVMLDPKTNWCGGRVVQLPGVLDSGDLLFVLRGDCLPLSNDEMNADDKPWQALMRWVLYRPWCMLLAQVVFTVEAWSAEQISGQMTLELAEDQMSNPYEPKRVDVVVTTPDGSEILCGSLGQLVVRVLDRLQVTLLARDEEVERLDERLAGVIRLLLERKVWRFDPRGASGSRPGYLIDDDFSTSCYRAFGSKYFYRAGSVLTAAIRASAEQWASEKQAKSRELAGVER
jgi:hypothetical protein